MTTIAEPTAAGPLSAAQASDELEAFIKTGMEAQQSVDAMLARIFGPLKLAPTVGQLSRFTQQLAEAERCEQRANELLGEINTLRAKAKSLRKAAPKILRETPQQELFAAPPAAEVGMVEVCTDLSHPSGISRPGDPTTGERVPLPVIEEREPTAAELDEEQQSRMERGLEEETPIGLPEAPAAAPTGEELHGQTFPAADLQITAEALEAMMKWTRITPGHDGQDADIDHDCDIAEPIHLNYDEQYWAMVCANVSSERIAYQFHPVRDANLTRDDSAGKCWTAARRQHANVAPEDVPLKGVFAYSQRDHRWLFEGDAKDRVTLVVPRQDVDFSDAGQSIDPALQASIAAAKARKCRVCGCTEEDCRQCIEKTGQPCQWVEEDLCSACVPAKPAIPEKPRGQSMSWHQWQSAIEGMYASRHVILKTKVEPAGYWLGLYLAGRKPAESFEAHLEDEKLADEEKDDEQKDNRQRTIEQLDPELRPLMDDPNVNDHGVYVLEVETYKIPAAKGTSIEIRVAQSNVDDQYRAACSVSTGQGGWSHAPSVNCTGYAVKNYAIRTEAQGILAQLRSRKNSTMGKAELARVNGCMLAVEKFLQSNPDAQVRSDAGQPAKTATPAKFKAVGVPYREQTYGQWFATFKGCLRSRAPHLQPGADDPTILDYFEHKERPGEAAAHFADRADNQPKKGKKR